MNAAAELDELFPPELGARLRPHVRVIRRRRGETILGSGTLSTEVYFLLSGRAQAVLLSEGGREVILGTVFQGALVGELAAIDTRPRSVSIIALTDCALATIPGRDFREALAEVPGAGLWIAERLARQVRSLTDRVFELHVLPVRTRLHCELLRLCVAAGCAGGTCTIDPAPNQPQLAAQIGSHREAVSREMSYLAGEGILEQRPVLRILELRALAAMVRAVAGELEIVLLAESLLGGAPAD